jgi:hypothetical protein
MNAANPEGESAPEERPKVECGVKGQVCISLLIYEVNFGLRFMH